MIHTNLEAMVDPDNWILLKQKYTEINKKDLPTSLISSYLIQDKAEPKLWHILTFWRSLKDLEEYRNSVDAPAWILVFRAVGAEPKLSISEVINSKQ